MPSLNLDWKSHIMGNQTTIGGVMVGDEGQEALLWLPLQQVEVLLKVIRKEHTIVILEVLVELGDNLAKAILFLNLFN